MKRSEKEKLKLRNSVQDPITRCSKEVLYSLDPPALKKKTLYPWEGDSNLPKITKDFFRCRGSAQNALRLDYSSGDTPSTYSDCEGGTRHGLPQIHGKAGVYPVLIDLLNYIQKVTSKRVVITSGHRCPQHNQYVSQDKRNQTSKHQIGAAVDFYVQGMEDQPLEIVSLLMQYYQETKSYSSQKEYQEFSRYTKSDTDVEIQPWMNKEIFIKLYQRDEGRDFDNRHPHPYLSIQVRYDRMIGERVNYEWKKANQGYSRCW